MWLPSLIDICCAVGSLRLSILVLCTVLVLEVQGHFHNHEHSHSQDTHSHHKNMDPSIGGLLHEFMHTQKEIHQRLVESDLERKKASGMVPFDIINVTDECASPTGICPCGKPHVRKNRYSKETSQFWVDDYKKNGRACCQAKSCWMCMKTSGDEVEWECAGTEAECGGKGFQAFQACEDFLLSTKLHCYRKTPTTDVKESKEGLDECMRFRCPFCNMQVDVVEKKARTLFNVECPFCKKAFKASNTTEVRSWYKTVRTERFLHRYENSMKELATVDEELLKAESELSFWKAHQSKLTGLDSNQLIHGDHRD